MSQAVGTSDNKNLDEIIEKNLKSWLRELNEPDRVFTKGKKVEIVFTIEAVNAILPRTEGVEDITLFKIPGTEYEVPAILPEKLQAVARRNMLSYLRMYRDKQKDRLRRYLEKLSLMYKIKDKKETNVGFVKAKEFLNNKDWNCYIQPPGGDVGEKATDVGMDGFCPACALFGTLIDKSKIEGIGDESIGVKSRVEFDPAIAISDRSVSVVGYTQNKVSDGVSWTGQSLFTEYHVVPGTVFIGKTTLEDVSKEELKAFLSTLSTISRLGGRERIFGGVKVTIIALRGGSYEAVSALELAKRLIAKYGDALPGFDNIVRDLKQELKSRGFIEVDSYSDGFRKLVEDVEIWDDLWGSTIIYDKRIIDRVLQLVKGEGKYEEIWKDEEVIKIMEEKEKA
ncbi:MAG: type I-D CRISPR-associated protein Cas7/Csc2 [Fervidicoccaceae archaeon]